MKRLSMTIIIVVISYCLIGCVESKEIENEKRITIEKESQIEAQKEQQENQRDEKDILTEQIEKIQEQQEQIEKKQKEIERLNDEKAEK